MHRHRFVRSLSIVLSAFTLLIGAAAPRPASGVTLGSLAGGGVLTVGSLTFSNFEVLVGGSMPSTLDDYPVQALGGGFRLSGPLSALFGSSGTLLLSYDVATSAPGGIFAASLFADGIVVGDGAQTIVAESIFGADDAPLGSLFTYAATGAAARVSDAMDLAGVPSLRVVKTIGVRSGILAAVPFIDQRFTVVPEPLPVMMLFGGLAGLARAGRR